MMLARMLMKWVRRNGANRRGKDLSAHPGKGKRIKGCRLAGLL